MARGCLMNPPPNGTHVRCVITPALQPVKRFADTPLAMHFEHDGLIVERYGGTLPEGLCDVAVIIHEPHPPLPSGVDAWILEKILHRIK